MGIGSWFRALVARFVRASSDAPGGEVSPYQLFGAPPRKGTAELLRAYRRMPWLRTVSNRLADECASAVRLQLYSGPDDDPARQPLDRRAPQYEMVEVLRRTTWGITPRQRWKLLHLWYGIVGEAYLKKVRSQVTGRPVSVLPINPLWVRELPTKASPVYRVRVADNADEWKIPAADMIALRDPDPFNPWARGVGVAESLADELDTDEGAAARVKAHFLNFGVPAGVISPKEGGDPVKVAAAEKKFNQQFRGPKKAGQVLFSPTPIDFERLDATFKEDNLIGVRKWTRDTVLQNHNAPPEIFGILENANRSTIDVAYYHLAIAVQVPWLWLLIGALQADFSPDFEGLGEAWWAFANPVPEDRQFKLQCVATFPPAFRGRDLRQLGGFAPDKQLDDLVLGAGASVAGPTNLPPGKSLDEKMADLEAFVRGGDASAMRRLEAARRLFDSPATRPVG